MSSVIAKIWKVKTKNPPKNKKNWLLQTMAQNRGLKNQVEMDEFLNPTIDQITNSVLSQIEKGVLRVVTAIKNKEKIIVYSDYDADGICASAIMWETLHGLGADVMPYVPHRIREGYGLSNPAIADLAKKGVNLIITVDHGVTASSQIEEANKLGVDVIVTDHHVLPKTLPKAVALVHTTKRCGAGVAWRFCWELLDKIRPEKKEGLLDKLELAAIATIADLVPLVGANRAIVKLGLEKLENTKRPGLKSLINNSGISGKIGTYEIGHILAPRINAMGRIEHGLDSLKLLCTKSPQQAQELAGLLAKTNTKRQDLTAGAITKAQEMVDISDLVGVIAHDSWHEGVIGLVASRLVEAHWRPMIVISRGQVYSKGSARSIPDFNIIEAIRASSQYLVDAGGHPMAAGFTIETQHIEIFKNSINTYAKKVIKEEMLSPVLEIECELDVEDINNNTLKTAETFSPYGVGNPEPFFLTKGMLVEDVRGVGQGNKHLKLQLNGISAIGFNLGESRTNIRPGYRIDVVYTLANDTYSGGLQLKIKDLAIVKN